MGDTKYKYKAIKVNGKRIDEHRHVMQLHLGRKLLSNEVVRHRDKNTRNNAIENLYVITRQQQYLEQLAEGALSKEILEGLARKAAGIKSTKKRHRKRPENYTPKPLGRPKKEAKPIPNTKPLIEFKRDKIYETRKIDAEQLIPLKVNNKTTIYIKKGTPQTEIDRIVKKYKP